MILSSLRPTQPIPLASSTSPPRRRLRYLVGPLLALLLAFPLGATTEAVEDDSSAISDFWSSVVKGAGSEAGETAMGLALSALGLSTESTDTIDLSEIEDLLEDIDSELEELVTEIAELECITSEDQATLTANIETIQGFYDTYSDWVSNSPTVPCWEESDDSGNECFGQTGVKTWLDEVTDPSSGIQTALDGIADMMITATDTGVLYVCVQYITDTYNSGDDPTTEPFDDRPYYDEVAELVDYYYGVQAQGAAMLSEAYHLQACITLGTDVCFFTGETSEDAASGAVTDFSYDPNDPGQICTEATSGSQTYSDCQDATSLIESTYDTLKDQLLQAGAPYSNHLLGIVWGDDLVFAKDMVDFTNNATYSGKDTSTCTSLDSSDPCGWTVGEYDFTFPDDVSYQGYPDDGETSLWQVADASDFASLLTTYNAQTSGTTTGDLGTWMTSVGFATDVGDMIVYTGDSAKNSSIDQEIVCFLHTAIDRSDSKQPWCDGTSGAEGTDELMKDDVQSCTSNNPEEPCTITTWKPASYLSSSSYDSFYDVYVVYTFMNGSGNLSVDTKAGWFEDSQGDNFQQFHWGRFSVEDLDCTVRTDGNQNPGGVYTLCGTDMQNWLDEQLSQPSS